MRRFLIYILMAIISSLNTVNLWAINHLSRLTLKLLIREEEDL